MFKPDKKYFLDRNHGSDQDYGICFGVNFWLPGLCIGLGNRIWIWQIRRTDR